MTAPTDVEQAKARLRAIVENEILLHVEPHLVVADVRLLLSECERLSREVTRWESEEVHEAMKCYQDGERLKAQRDELAKALEHGVDVLGRFRSYYITDNRLGLDPAANAEVRLADDTLGLMRAALAKSEPKS
jgi:hypothetical protein